MRAPRPRPDSVHDLRAQLERLAGLPLRPASVRLALSALDEEGTDPLLERLEDPQARALVEVDPGWVVAEGRWGRSFDPLRLIAASGWWRTSSGRAGDALGRLWRHAVAVGLAARRLAREGDDPSPDHVGRAGLLHGLGRWGVAAFDPDWIADWIDETDPDRRRRMEVRRLGLEMSSLGRILAERWGCDPLIVDAAWLHADGAGELNTGASEPGRLALVQRAYASAERTPWALSAGSSRDPNSSDPRHRLLVAEVQVRCGSPFVASDASHQEENLSRSHARLRRRLSALEGRLAVGEGLLRSLAESPPQEDPASWAERAGRAWCALPGVATARVVWVAPYASATPENAGTRPERPASRVLRLSEAGRPCAEVRLWEVPGEEPLLPQSALELGAWQGWAASIAHRTRLEERLESVLQAHREWIRTEERRSLAGRLDALAEFAAGAGHELNNPLAVIVGRAQILLARAADPDTVRSLRAILVQAQRAHRILRDLMFVARTPEPRPRSCQPEEILKASLRDLRTEAEARGVRLVAEPGGTAGRAWADPDSLRHVADILIRNALEATPKGGTIQVTSAGDRHSLLWKVRDSGRGISASEGEHLFDPFYCGRQAGRGLGLGLPRAARIVEQSLGELQWQSQPGQGTLVQVNLPLGAPPAPLPSETEQSPASPKAEPSLPVL